MSFETDLEPAPAAKQKTSNNSILAFHKLTDRLTFGSTNYSPSRLTNLLQFLSESGYNFVPLKVLLEEQDSRNLAITFDDGYSHLLRNLPPIIERFKLSPTIFIPTGYIGRKNSWDYSSFFRTEPHLDKVEIKELASMGVEFGSHGHDHIDLSRCSDRMVEQELRISKELLENILGKRINSISYPFGRFNSRVGSAAAKIGYEQGVTMSLPWQFDNNLSLGRIPVYFFDKQDFVLQKIQRNRFYRFHKSLCRTINFLSGGTILLNQLLSRVESSSRSSSS